MQQESQIQNNLKNLNIHIFTTWLTLCYGFVVMICVFSSSLLCCSNLMWALPKIYLNVVMIRILWVHGEAHFEFLTFDTHRFQIGHFCFNLLLTRIVQPHSVLTWHCFAWTQFCCTLLSLTLFWLSLVEPRLSFAALTSVSLTLG